MGVARWEVVWAVGGLTDGEPDTGSGGVANEVDDFLVREVNNTATINCDHYVTLSKACPFCSSSFRGGEGRGEEGGERKVGRGRWGEEGGE